VISSSGTLLPSAVVTNPTRRPLSSTGRVAYGVALSAPFGIAVCGGGVCVRAASSDSVMIAAAWRDEFMRLVMRISFPIGVANCVSRAAPESE
jgi:hypothetical protein